MQILAVLTMISTIIVCAHSISQYSGEYPICVVGAGISGLTVGRELQKKGYRNVLIFEKSHRVGGKLDTYREGNDIQVEVGALVHDPSCYSFLEYMREFNLNSVPLNSLDAIGFDPNSGTFRTPRIDLREMGGLAMAAFRYTFYHGMYARDLEFGYENASPDIFVSFSEWLDQRNLGALKPIFVVLITHLGYGALDDIPAIYGLKYIDPDFIVKAAPVIGGFFTVGEGLDTFANRLASNLNVLLNKEVVRIHRELDHQEIYFTDYENLAGKNIIRSQKCVKVILAFPPLLTRLNTILDLSEYESETLKHVKINKYATAANYIPTLNASLYYEGFRQASSNQTLENVNPTGNGEVVLMAKPSSPTKMYTSYSWIRGDYNDTMNELDQYLINSQLDGFLKKVDKNSKIHYRTTTEYFPHVDSDSLHQGFYKRFGRIQGQGGVYYATPLLTFEIMEHSIRGAKMFVQKYF